MISIASLIDVQRKKSVYAVTVYMPKSKTILDCIMLIISVKRATITVWDHIARNILGLRKCNSFAALEV